MAWVAGLYRVFLPAIQGSWPPCSARWVRHADWLCRAEWARLYRHWPGDARARTARGWQDQYAGHCRMVARQSRRRHEDHAREHRAIFSSANSPAPVRWVRWAIRLSAGLRSRRTGKFVPLGAPVFLDMEHNIADGLWVAQDTGGAIKGLEPVRYGSGVRASEAAQNALRAACHRADRR